MTRRRLVLVRVFAVVAVLVLVGVGCGVFDEGRSVEGYTFGELMDGVKADPAHFEVSHECFENDNTVGGRIGYRARIRLTNTDDRQRSFEVWVDVPAYEDESPDKSPVEWLRSGETVEFTGFLGWQDDFPDGCPEYVLDVYQNPVEG